MNFNVLPSLVALAILVVVFEAILRQGAAERLQLWLTAWVLVLIHFIAQFVNVGHGLWNQIATAVSLGSLELASISFLISMSPRAGTARRQLLLGTILGVPALAYTTAAVWGVAAHSFYYGVVVVALAATSLLAWNWYYDKTSYLSGLLFGCLVFRRVLFRSDRKSTRLNSSHLVISYAVFCLKKKKKQHALRTRYEACV